MSVAVPSRVVEERKISRNWSPVLSPAGIRLQSVGTLTAGADCSTSLTSTVSAEGPAQAGVGPFEITAAERGLAEGERRPVDVEKEVIRVEDRFAWRVKIYAQGDPNTAG